MNKLKGFIKSIQSSENISVVDIDVDGISLCSIIVETQKTADYLKVGNEVYILFKETEVSVGKNVQGLLSLRNQINCTVQNIEKGKVLSKVVLNFKNYNIVSIITTNSVEKLQLKIGDNVKAFIKSNEVSLMEI